MIAMNPPVFVSVIENPNSVDATINTIRYDKFVRLLLKGDTEQLEALHWAGSLMEEAGELWTAVKREYIYNKPRDLKNIIEELGDIEFFLQCAYNHYGIHRSEVIQANAEKLAERYRGLQYSDRAAQERADKKGSER